MTYPYENQLAKALEASFINENTHADEVLQAKLLTNDFEKHNKVLTVILKELSQCDTFLFSVAFVTKGGLTTLLNAFAALKAKGIQGKLLTSTYQLFNTPDTFKQLMKLKDVLEVRIYDYKSFHAKGYIFKKGDESNFIIGSSNLTQDALLHNHEWNIKLNTTFQGALTKELEREFHGNWERSKPLTEEWLEDYAHLYEASKIVDINKALEAQKNQGLKLNKMQREALEALEDLREQGKDKAILISATGTGKTYLSAFDVLHFKPKKFLFVIHRENIARAAMKSFKHVLGHDIKMAVLSGNHHLSDTPADYIFATIQTISKDHYLDYFPEDYFDYIVIDEVHRAGATTYEKLLNHFKPKFLLGMSATPERTDGFNIVELFDYNIAYEIRLQHAMAYDLLCPFHYFGVREFITDGHLEALADFNQLIDDKRIDHILEKVDYYGFSGNRVRGLIFCSRKEEAKELSKKFNERGFKTVALTGESSEESRRIAIDRLEQKNRENGLDYIFTVDIFNEGIDIPKVNQIVMLRPTESSIIFIQQLGRGLRKSDDKEYVVILDFIGNYQNNYMIPMALSGNRNYDKDALRRFASEANSLIPGASTVSFDEITQKKIYESINQAKFSQLNVINKEYNVLKNIVGRIPTLVDFYEHGAIDPALIFKKMKTYHAYLKKYEKAYEIRLTKAQEMVLLFITTEFSNGHRPHEIEILKALINEEEVRYEDFKEQFEKSTLDHALGILQDQYLQNKDRQKYEGCRFIKEVHETIIIDSYFKKTLDEPFKSILMDLLDYILMKHHNEFSKKYEDTDLVLYEKYTRRDVCRLLKWENDEGNTLNGYRVKHKMCPIFVTYNKNEEISYTIQYQDQFVNRHQFSWMTRSQRTIQSAEIQPIINPIKHQTDIHLFIKKGDDEGSEHYYLGRLNTLHAEETIIKDKKDPTNTKPIVNIRFSMKDSVREDIYDYLVK